MYHNTCRASLSSLPSRCETFAFAAMPDATVAALASAALARLDAGADRRSGPLRGAQGLLGLIHLQVVGAAFSLAERVNELLVVGARA